MEAIENTIPIYKIVNGERIQLPERDPNRNYQRINDYDIELTDEEERERSNQAALWEAERPKREAEQKRQQDAYEKFLTSMKYENRVVAFLDVLGWKTFITQSLDNPELTKKLGQALKIVQAIKELSEWTTEHGGEKGWPGDCPAPIYMSSFELVAL